MVAKGDDSASSLGSLKRRIFRGKRDLWRMNGKDLDVTRETSVVFGAILETVSERGFNNK